MVPAVSPVTFSLKVTGAFPKGIAVPPVAGTRVPKASLQTPGLDVEYRNQAVAAAPVGFAEPVSVPVVAVSAEGVVVVTVGTWGGVVKDSTEPRRVPMVFCAMAQNQYWLPGSRPESDRASVTGTSPAPRLVPPAAGARVPKVSLHVPGSTLANRNQAVVEVPLGVIDEFSCAVVEVTGDAACVSTVGSATVVKLTIAPSVVPCPFCAMAHQKYVVLGVSPDSTCVKVWAALPAPMFVPPVLGVRVPKVSLHVPGFTVEKRNQAVVASPRAVAEPLSVAPVSVMKLVDADVTNGASAGVVKDATVPKLVPTAFEAIAQ